MSHATGIATGQLKMQKAPRFAMSRRLCGLSLCVPNVEAIEALREAAAKEGFTFLDRLIDHWNSGQHGFGHSGEKLIGGYDGATLVALGCLTQDPQTDDQRAGVFGISTCCRPIAAMGSAERSLAT